MKVLREKCELIAQEVEAIETGGLGMHLEEEENGDMDMEEGEEEEEEEA